MNPLAWRAEHLTALFLSAIIGIALGIVLGFVVSALGAGSNAVSFRYWIGYPFDHGVEWWGLFGFLVGGGAMYATLLIRR